MARGLFAGGLGHGLEGVRDFGVVVQTDAAVGALAQHGPRQGPPLLGRVRAKAGADAGQVSHGLVFGVEAGVLADVVADALERGPLEHWAHVVEHQTARRESGLSGQGHADEPAHAGADPVDDRLGVRRAPLHQQLRDVGHVGADVVAAGVLQPIAVAAAGHVDADDAGMGLQGLGQHIEVARLAREAVHTHHPVAAVGVVAWPDPAGHAAGLATRGLQALDGVMLE